MERALIWQSSGTTVDWHPSRTLDWPSVCKAVGVPAQATCCLAGFSCTCSSHQSRIFRQLWSFNLRIMQSQAMFTLRNQTVVADTISHTATLAISIPTELGLTRIDIYARNLHEILASSYVSSILNHLQQSWISLELPCVFATDAINKGISSASRSNLSRLHCQQYKSSNPRPGRTNGL